MRATAMVLAVVLAAGVGFMIRRSGSRIETVVETTTAVGGANEVDVRWEDE